MPTYGPYPILNTIRVEGVGDASTTSNTGTDDTAAINRAFTLASASLHPVMVEFPAAKVYRTTGFVNVPATNSNVIVWGYGSEMRATDPTNQAFIIKGSNVAVYGMKFSSYNDGTKGSPHRVQTIGTVALTNIRFIHCEISGAIDMGLLIGNVDVLLIDDCDVHDTNADGIHLTRGCTNFQVINNRVWNTGDDNIAVVSNQSNGAYCSDGLIKGNVCKGSRQTLADAGSTPNTVGRNIAIAGGKDITVSTNICSGSNQAAIMVCADTNGTTYGCEDITVEFNKVKGSNIQGIAGHADIFVTSVIGATMPIIGTILRGNTLKNNVAGDAIAIGTACIDTRATGNKIIKPQGRGIFVSGTAADTEIDGNTIKRATGDGIFTDTLITGYLIINGNLIDGANDGNSGSHYAICVSPAVGVTSMTAHDNVARVVNSLTLTFGFGTSLAVNDNRDNRQVA